MDDCSGRLDWFFRQVNIRGNVMRNNSLNKGFTLIELVMVIVILGILSAIAIPKFVDLRSDAQTASLAGIVGGLSAAASSNYAGCSVVNNVVTANKCAKVSKCSEVAALLTTPITIQSSAAAANTGLYYIPTANDTAITTNGTTATCTLSYGGSNGVIQNTFTAIGAGN